ncbi:MAG: hypothetical protein KTR16_13465 [Acidiferrobacterales bacterium]|nr:hypothetical protein [Acidiferrobacterales bacterium]
MMNSKTMELVLSCLLMITLSQTSQAQSSSISATPSSKCGGGYTYKPEFNLCVSDVFSQSPFSRLKVNLKCDDDFARVPGLPFCVLDKRKARLELKGDHYFISKNKKEKCGPKFLGLEGKKFCISHRLAITSDDNQLVLRNMASVDCSWLGKYKSKACARRCDPGFLRSMSKGMCIDWELARQGHPEFEKLDRECQSDHWVKASTNENSLCVPSLTSTMSLQNEGNNITKGNSVWQVVFMTFPIPQAQLDAIDEDQPNTATSGFKAVPVAVYGPDWIRAIQ